MQSNRFLTFILSSAMLLPMAAIAQTTNPGATSGDTGNASTATAPNQERGQKFAEALNLTPDQQAAIKSIHENAKQQAQGIKNDSSLTPDQKKAKFKELRKSTRAQTMAKLTPDQQQKFKEMRKEHRGHGRHGRKGESADQTQG
jgi:Spy/CpxP family protein refolding chaperone